MLTAFSVQQVTRSRRSTRRQHAVESPRPSDSTTVLRSRHLSPPLHPHQHPTRISLRRQVADAQTASATDPSSQDNNSSAILANDASVQALPAAAGRRTRSSARQQIGARPPVDSAAADERRQQNESDSHQANGDDSDHALAVALAAVEQEQVGTRTLRSRCRAASPKHEDASANHPSNSRISQDSGAQLASEWQNAVSDAQPQLRRSTRAQHHAVAAQQARQQASAQEADAQAVGSSQPTPEVSPVSSREARAQNRAARHWQVYSPDPSPEAATEAAAAAAASASADEPAVQRLQQQVRHDPHATANDAQQDTSASRQGPTGIRVRLRQPLSRSMHSRRSLCRQPSEADDTPSAAADATHAPRLRISLRSRKS